MKLFQPSRKKEIFLSALVFGSVYTLISAVWIYASDTFVLSFFDGSDAALISSVQTSKGLLFVFLSGFFIFWLVGRNLLKLERSRIELAESEESYRMLFKQHPNPMWIFDVASLRFLDVNEATVRLYGYSEEEFLLKTILDVRPPADIPKILDSIKASEDFRNVGVWRHIAKDGHEIFVEVFTHGIYYKGARARIAMLQDVTEKQRLEAKTLEMQRLEGIGTIAGGIAHDLKNIFHPITLAIGVLKQPQVSRQQQIQFLDIIEKSSNRGLDIIQQFLSFIRGKTTSYQMMNVNECMREVETIIQQSFPKNIRIETSHATGLPKIYGDPTQVQQVIMNLCINARDAMPEGGTLMTGVQVKQPAQDMLSANPDAEDKPYIVITVSDTGTGISPDVAEKIFMPFFTTKAEWQGTGLGLPSVKNIVHKHNGFITFTSAPGRGSEFTAWFPAIPQSENRSPFSIAE